MVIYKYDTNLGNCFRLRFRNYYVDFNRSCIHEHLSKRRLYFFFMRIFVKTTNPIINLFKFITPSFLFGPFIALYVAWFFYLFRFYAMPYILGYDVWGMLAFPLESDFSRQLYQLFN